MIQFHNYKQFKDNKEVIENNLHALTKGYSSLKPFVYAISKKQEVAMGCKIPAGLPPMHGALWSLQATCLSEKSNY